MWRLTEERISACPAGWIETQHVPGHGMENMVKQGRAGEEQHIANDQADIMANKRRSLGPPQEVVEAESRAHQAALVA